MPDSLPYGVVSCDSAPGLPGGVSVGSIRLESLLQLQQQGCVVARMNSGNTILTEEQLENLLPQL